MNHGTQSGGYRLVNGAKELGELVQDLLCSIPYPKAEQGFTQSKLLIGHILNNKKNLLKNVVFLIYIYLIYNIYKYIFKYVKLTYQVDLDHLWLFDFLRFLGQINHTEFTDVRLGLVSLLLVILLDFGVRREKLKCQRARSSSYNLSKIIG